MHSHSRSAVQHAAIAAAEYAAFVGGTEEDAREVIERMGVEDATVSVSMSATEVRVDVSAPIATVLPGPWSEANATAYRVREES